VGQAWVHHHFAQLNFWLCKHGLVAYAPGFLSTAHPCHGFASPKLAQPDSKGKGTNHGGAAWLCHLGLLHHPNPAAAPPPSKGFAWGWSITKFYNMLDENMHSHPRKHHGKGVVEQVVPGFGFYFERKPLWSCCVFAPLLASNQGLWHAFGKVMCRNFVAHSLTSLALAWGWLHPKLWFGGLATERTMQERVAKVQQPWHCSGSQPRSWVSMLSNAKRIQAGSSHLACMVGV